MRSILRIYLLGIVLSFLSSCLPSTVYSPEGAMVTPRGYPVSFFTQNNGRIDSSTWPISYTLKLPLNHPVSNFDYRKFAINSAFWIMICFTLRHLFQLFRRRSINEVTEKDESTRTAGKDKTSDKNPMLFLLLMYFFLGLTLVAVKFEKDLRQFHCPYAHEPHFGMTTSNYKNPDPGICKRRAFNLAYVPGRLAIFFFVLAFLGVHLLVKVYLTAMYIQKSTISHGTPQRSQQYLGYLRFLLLPGLAIILGLAFAYLITVIEATAGLYHGNKWTGFYEIVFLNLSIGMIVYTTVTARMIEPLSKSDNFLRLHLQHCLLLYVICVPVLFIFINAVGKVKNGYSAVLMVLVTPILINLLTLLLVRFLSPRSSTYC